MAEIPINYLKYIDQDGTEKKVYPITVTDAVYDSDGNKLSNVLLGVLKDTDISNVQSDSTTTVPSSALLKATDDKIGDTSSLPGESSNVVSAITQLNSDMGGMKFFTNISSLGLEGDTATPNSVIDAMPYRSALVVASNVFTNPAWNFPDGRYTLEIISVTSGRAIISLYGKTSTEADYRMFLNNENNYPSGEWTKIVSNADLRDIFSGRDNYIDTLSSIQQLTTPGFYKIDNISSAVNDNAGSNPLSDYATGDFYGLLMGEIMNSTNGCRYGTLILTSPRLVGDLWVGNIWDYKFAGWYKK